MVQKALTLTGSKGSASNASPRLLNEKIYAKVTKPPKTSAGTQLVAQGSPSGKAAPEKSKQSCVTPLPNYSNRCAPSRGGKFGGLPDWLGRF